MKDLAFTYRNWLTNMQQYSFTVLYKTKKLMRIVLYQIHAVPASSISSIMRSSRFGKFRIPLSIQTAVTNIITPASEEWNQYFSNGRVDSIAGGWRGIIHASQAQFDPLAAFQWFSQQNFDYGWLDGGASRTWYLAYTAALASA
jgi:endoglucanase Acf2